MPHKFFPIFLLLPLSICMTARAQETRKIELLTGGTKISLRGLSPVTDDVVWASGSSGAVGRSVDGGTTWEWTTVKGYEKRDFRDIEAFDANTAIIMAIAEPADILKTTDGGKTWKLVYENTAKGMFLDAMEFRDKDHGFVIGDPVDGRFFLARTSDGGDSWQELPANEMPAAEKGDGCFATSGTNIRPLGKKGFCFVGGGPRSVLSIRGKMVTLPLINGKESTGANSVVVKENRQKEGAEWLVIVGGDFAKDTIREKNCVLTHDGGATWITPQTAPHGYRGCVEYIGKDLLICCGTSGVDISTDDGMNWQLVSPQGFHVCHKAKKGKAVFLAGGGGRIGKLTSPSIN